MRERVFVLGEDGVRELTNFILVEMTEEEDKAIVDTVVAYDCIVDHGWTMLKIALLQLDQITEDFLIDTGLKNAMFGMDQDFLQRRIVRNSS